MVLLKIYIHKPISGFTLIEVVTCFAIIAFLAAFISIVDMQVYQKKTFEEEESGIRSALGRARSSSMNNVCLGSNCTDGRKHGVFFETNTYTLFQGDGYSVRDSNRDEIFPVGQEISLSGIQEVVFEQLSGNVMNPGKIEILRSDGRRSEITINAEGAMSY